MNFYTLEIDVGMEWISLMDLHNERDIKYHVCSTCGFNELVYLDEITPVFECGPITKRMKFPDVILYGGLIHASNYWRVVSRKFKDIFESNKFTGAYFQPVKLVREYRKGYIPVEEEYYLMQITGKGEIDYPSMGFELYICKECHMAQFEGRFPLSGVKDEDRYPVLLKEWDGSDIFGNGFCTAEFARKFMEAGMVGAYFRDAKDAGNYKAKRLKLQDIVD